MNRHSEVITAAQLAEFAANPLKQLPLEWRPHVWQLWAYFSHLLPNQLALCSRLRAWEADGLTLEVFQRIAAVMTASSRAGRYKFAADVLADLGELVANRGSSDPYMDAMRESTRQVQEQARAWKPSRRPEDSGATILADEDVTGSQEIIFNGKDGE